MASETKDSSGVTKSHFLKRIWRPTRGVIIFSFIIPALVAVLVAYVTTDITFDRQNEYEQPKLKVLGVMPIHLYDETELVDTTFRFHKLALILKIENLSPTPAIVHTAIFQGCAEIDPFVADMHMPEKERLGDGIPVTDYLETYENSIQRISVSASICPDSQSLPPHAISYVGALFSLDAQVAYYPVEGSVSTEGDCDKITVSNPHPTIFQVLDIQTIQDRPKGLHEGFYNGKISITLFAGNEPMDVPSELIGSLISLRTENWEELALPEMFENPDTTFPPLIRDE